MPLKKIERKRPPPSNPSKTKIAVIAERSVSAPYTTTAAAAVSSGGSKSKAPLKAKKSVKVVPTKKPRAPKPKTAKTAASSKPKKQNV